MTSDDHAATIALVRDLFAGEDGSYLDATLEKRTVPQLRAWALELGWRLGGQRRSDIVMQMREHFASAESAALALDQLTEFERRVLSLAAWMGRVDDVELIDAIAALLDILPDSWTGAPGAAGPSADLVEEVIDDVVARGYLIQDGLDRGFSSLSLTKAFSTCLLPVTELTPGLVPPSNQDIHPARDPVRDLVAAWRAVDKRAPIAAVVPFEKGIDVDSLSGWPATVPGDSATTGRHGEAVALIPPAGLPLPDHAADAVAQAIGEQGTDSAAFWSAMLIAADALVPSPNGKELDADPSALAALLSFGPDDLLALLVAMWIRMPYGLWDELSWLQLGNADWVLVRDSKWWRYSPETYNTQLIDNRLFLLDLLGRWPRPGDHPDDAWVDVAAFSRALQAAFPDAILPGAGVSAWHAADSDDLVPLAPREAADWARGSDRVLRYVIDGPLRWLGLVETAGDPGGEVVAARLTPLGCALVDGMPAEPHASTPPTWLDERAVEVDPCIANGRPIAALSSFAAPVGSTGGPLRFCFTADALRPAFDAGQLPDEVVDELDRAGVPLPAELRKEMTVWWQCWGRLRQYHELTLIELSDATLAQELLATTDLARWLVVQISPTALAIETDAVAPLVAALEAAGHTPRVVVVAEAKPEPEPEPEDATGWPGEVLPKTPGATGQPGDTEVLPSW